MKLSAMVTVLHNWSKYKSKSQYSPSENPKKLQFFAKKVKCAAEMSWPTDLLPQIRKVSVKKTIDLTVCPHLKRTTTESFSSSQTSTREPHSVQRSDNTDWPSSQREKTWYEWAPFTPLKLNLLLTFFFATISEVWTAASAIRNLLTWVAYWVSSVAAFSQQPRTGVIFPSADMFVMSLIHMCQSHVGGWKQLMQITVPQVAPRVSHQ